jgi:hypothetical protein
MAATTQPVLANKKVSPNTPAPVVEFISSGDTGTILSVQFKNELKQKFTLMIRDEAGNSIYRKEFDSVNFAKTFQLVNDNNDNNSDLTMVIITDDGSDFSFNINTSFEVVKKVEVSKL